jgi:hypothetical protein
MRITFTLDDDVFRLVKAYAEGRSLSMRKAFSELVCRGLSAPPKTRVVNGLVVFDVRGEKETVTSGQVKQLETEAR